MTNETRERIKAYKRALPGMRERVVAVALLLAMSVSMMASASFAWITLSRSPELAGMQTTVAANGNLEIALAKGPVISGMIQPLESQIGDSSSSERENWGIFEANTTWGNLINLSDSQYGLDRIVLQPALLSDYGLHDSPLHGASYGEDGRVINTLQEYGYASLKQIGEESFEFTAGDDVQYGVRAISSMRTENILGGEQIAAYETAVRKAYDAAALKYKALVSDGRSGSATPTVFKDKTAVAALQRMVSVFAQDKVSETESSYDESIWYLHQMMIELKAIMELEGEGLLNMANWQAYVFNKNTNIKTFDSLATLIQEYKEGKFKQHGVTLNTMSQFVTDYEKLCQLIIDMQPLADSCHPDKVDRPDVKWTAIDDEYINPLVGLNTATLQTDTMAETKVYNIGMGVATKLLGEKNAKIRIKNGIIKNIEQRALAYQNRMSAYVTISVKYVVSVEVGGTVFTDVPQSAEPSYVSDLQFTKSLDNSSASGQKYAKDTYGMAIDLWVRTNAPESVLTLEGSVLYEEEQETFTDSKGRTVPLYLLSIEQEEVVDDYDVYKNPDDDKWYYYSDNTEVQKEALQAGTLTAKMKKIAVGYRGENRIWEDWENLTNLGLIATDATTQGAGSCFVFYAATPAEQSKLLDMLRAFRMVLIDSEGTVRATAVLDIDNAYINQGKVTAPLTLSSGVEYVDENGKTQTGVMQLSQNQATWLTAIIYLDGTLLENENVLSASDIMGQLNLQFGTNNEMDVRNDSELQMEHRTITATATYAADPSKKSTNSEEPISLEYNAAGHDVAVTLEVDGEQPEKVSGFFVRVINDTQGTRGQSVDFTKNNDGTWTGSFKLTSPGTYVMRSLIVNGIEYSLREKTLVQKDNHPSVSIDGMSIDYVTTTHRSGTYRTSNPSIQVGVYAKITADVALNPKTVIAQFFNEAETKQYNARLEFNPNSDGGRWEGTVSLNSSDTYYLRYLSIDGEVVEVDPSSQTRLVCYVGMKCRIDWTGILLEDGTVSKDTSFLYQGEAFNITMVATIMDDGNAPMERLEGVHLYYHSDSSSDDDQGFHAPMTWNEEEDWYEATFEVDKPGTFLFDRLAVGTDSTLGKALVSPTFTVSTPVPPSYVEGSSAADARQLGFDSNHPATMKLTLSDASSASVWAELEELTLNNDGTYTATGTTIKVPHSVKRSAADGTEFLFNLVKDGIWKLKRVYCQGVYNGTTSYPVTGAEPNSSNSYVVDVTTDDQVITEVITTVNMVVYYNGTQQSTNFKTIFGKDNGKADGKTVGAIFTPNKNAELKVVVTDYKNMAIPELESLKWNIQHNDANMVQYGGYSGPGYGNMESKNLTLKSGTTTDYVAPEVTFDLAGEYTSTITATFNLGQDAEGNPITYSRQIPVEPSFAVYSVAPTVKITSAQYASKDGGASSFTDTATTVYYKEGTEKSCGITYYNYTPADVTIELSGYGNASGAKIEFTTSNADGKVHLYEESQKDDGTATNAYAWSGNGACKRYMGHWESKTGSDDKTAAGTLTGGVLVMTHNAKSYTVDIPDITINNPS